MRPSKPPIHSILRFATAFWRDTSGVILPYVTIMLVVIVGMSVLALDGARYVNLQTQLQHGADALALAGAAELDRMPDSACRATTAINNYIANVYGPQAGENVTATKIRFLSSLPVSDSTYPIPSTYEAPKTNPDTTCTNGSTAQFVEVTVTPVAMQTILPASFFGGSNTLSTGAQSVAGSYLVLCDFTPVYICNPYEQPGDSYAQATNRLLDAAASHDILQRLIQLKNDATYSIGNFGYLSSPLGNGASALRDTIARVNPSACLRQSGVDTQTGKVQSEHTAFNVRFDIYDAPMNYSTDPNYRPAQNVRKGYEPASSGKNPACNATIATPATWPGAASGALPYDTAWPNMNGRMGNGQWDCATYWTTVYTDPITHILKYPAPTQRADGAPGVCGNGVSTPTTLSRYDVYRYEITTSVSGQYVDQYVHTFPDGNKESGAPACYTGGTPPSDAPDRRILYGAVLNCQCLQAGDSCYPGAPKLNGTVKDAPVASFAEFFLTLPVQAPKGGADTAVYTEMTGLLKPGSKNVFYSVQLYR